MKNSTRIAVVIIGLALGACGGQIDREDVDGVDCVIARDNTGASPVAISCDWDDKEPQP